MRPSTTGATPKSPSEVATAPTLVMVSKLTKKNKSAVFTPKKSIVSQFFRIKGKKKMIKATINLSESRHHIGRRVLLCLSRFR